MVQKRNVKAAGGAEVRRSTNRLTCEVADQGQKRPISTTMGKTEPKSGRAEEGTRVTVGLALRIWDQSTHQPSSRHFMEYNGENED
jgi:hypothetical protein